MKFLKHALLFALLCLHGTPLYAGEVKGHAQDEDFNVAFVKVSLFLVLAYALSVFIKRKQQSFSTLKHPAESIELLTHKIIKDSSSISLIKVDNKKVLITTSKHGGVAMLALDDLSDQVEKVQEPRLREVSNA